MAPAQPGSPAPPAPAGATPPHSIEAEQAVLGAVMLSEKAHYAFIVEQDLKPDDFYRARHRDHLRGDVEALRRGRRPRRPERHRGAEGLRQARGGRRRLRDRRASPRPCRPSATCAATRRSSRSSRTCGASSTPPTASSRASSPARASRATSSTRPSGRSSTSAWAATARTSSPSARCSSRRSRAGRSSPRAGRASPACAPASRTSTRSPAASSPATSSSSPRAPRWASRRSSTNIAENVALDKSDPRPVALFSLEMSEGELAQRFVASQASIKGDDLRKGKVKPELWKRVLNAAGDYDRSKLYIDDSSDISLLDIRAKARRLHQSFHADGGLGLIIIDYLQLMRADTRYDSRVAAGRRDEPRAEDPRPRAEGPRHRALAALPWRRVAHRQAADALRPARVGPDRAGRRPRDVHLPRRVLQPRGVRRPRA